MGKAIFFVKGSLLVEVLVKALEAVKVGGKSPFVKYPILNKLFSLLAKHNFLKDSCNKTKQNKTIHPEIRVLPQ